jgi:hypothetical protein
MDSLPHPTHMPCDDCGASVEIGAAAAHVCEPSRRLEFILFGLREEIDAFEERFAEWLATAQGRFEQFYARRVRPA